MDDYYNIYYNKWYTIINYSKEVVILLLVHAAPLFIKGY